jgi:predicted nuclease of restriction endonuclease-like (RecB) superfamily
MSKPPHYAGLLAEVKQHIQAAQSRAALAVNRELIRLYWQIGGLLDARQAQEGWGAGVIPRLARDIRNEMPEVKGFSERNIDRMLAFARAYPLPAEFSPQAVAKLPAPRKAPQAVAKTGAEADSLLWQIPWGHHALMLEKLATAELRRWYMAQTVAQGWSRSTLALQISAQAHARQGQAVSNFADRDAGGRTGQGARSRTRHPVTASPLVKKIWNFCHTLRDDGGLWPWARNVLSIVDLSPGAFP